MTKGFKKAVSLLLAVLMVVTMLPVTAIAEEIEDLGCAHHLVHNEECGYSENSECNFHCEICESDVIYSDEKFYFNGDAVLPEESGKNEIVFSREDSGKTAFATVVIYDYSANYGTDYTVSINGETVQKIEGAVSLFDAFRDNGERISGIELDAAAAIGKVYEEENPEDIKASDMFAEFDSLGIRAAEIPVTFAKGENSVILTVETVDDSESEYDEIFMFAVFDEKGEVSATAQALLTIDDNEKEPEAKITFNCETLVELGEDGKAALSFKREGNLATNSLAVLFHDGNPLGYVDFAPYQEEQTVEVVYAGTYMLGDENGNITDMTEVNVNDPFASEYTVPEGADPILDAVPEVYATIPDGIRASYSNWFPEWAKKTGWLETETQIINMGKVNESRWRNESNSSKGSTSYFPDGLNEVHVNTSGTGSHVSSGTNKVKSVYAYDFTGIESLQVVGELSGVDKNAKIGLEVDNCTGWHKTVSSSGVYTMTATMPFKYQGISTIHVYNRDPQSTGGGTNYHITNGWVMNKRPYYIEVRDDLSPNLSYYGAIETHPQGNDERIKVYPYPDNHTYNRVVLKTFADTGYPARLKGYKLYTTNKTSKEISLNGSDSFYFTFNFLRDNENTYCWQGDVNGDGKGDAVFSIIPIYEKIPVNYELKSAKGGNIVLQNPNGKLYMGDYAVFKNANNSELKLTGVAWKAYNDLSSDAVSGTMDADADGLVRFKLNNLYTRYEFKGIYSADATSLSVYYADEKPNGKLDKEGIVVPAENYVKNEYVTITAQPNSGYITKWTAGDDVYYGNVLYYQLTGNADENKIEVSFIKESAAGVETKNINGILNSSNVNLRTKENTPSVLSNAEITVTSGKYYSAKSNSKGNFSISGFKGVPGGKYTALITYAGGFAYKTFTFGDSESYILTLPQFTAGDCYPAGVTAGVSGGSPFTNAISLESGGIVDIQVAVQGKPNSKPTKVNLYFYDAVNDIGSLYEKAIEEQTSSVGDVSYWEIKIPTDDIPVNTRLYVSVDSEKTIILRDENGNYKGSETYTATSAIADGGYDFVVDYEDSRIPVYYDVPSTPSPVDAKDVFIEDLNIPLLGIADFSLSSASGGFFVTRTDPDTGYIYLMCGYSFEGLYAKGSIVDKYDAAKKSGQQAMEHSLVKKKNGSSEPAVQTMTGTEDTGTAANGAKKPSNWTFSPVFMFQIAAKPGTNDPNTYYLAGYETIVGFDTWFYKNFPFNLYGFPLYISVSFGLEAALQMAMNFKNEQVALEDATYKNVMNAMGAFLHDEESSVEAIEGVIGAPKLAVGAKGGAGINNFLSAFLEATVRIPILFQFTPSFQVAGQIGFDIAAGADLVIFSGSLPIHLLDIYYGDNEDDDDDGDGIVNDEGDSDLVSDLKSVQRRANGASLRSSEAVYVDRENFDFEEELNKMTFSLMRRNGGANLRGISAPEVVSKDTFKNTGVHLWEFENGKIAVAYLRDNGKTGLNYLSAVYAVSSDGGKTWGEEKYFSNNTSVAGSSLQYDINIFELEDRLLVTWSEADFDNLISEMEVDPENLTADHVAKLMAAMNLRGVFVDKHDGSLIGEAFTIAENSTVACGVLDAVQNGENVYVYYQRNAVRETHDYDLSDLLTIERTIAMARANVNRSDNWISTPVRIENENGQQYRIVDVEPFAFNGIVGEIIAIDRDGKFAVQKADGSWENSDDDRVLLLRTYEFDKETGEPKTAVLSMLTETSDCSQKPQVVSDGKDVYLFFNQNGNIVYLKNFVVNEDADEDVKTYSAFAIKNGDGSYSSNVPFENDAKSIASHGSINYGTKFSVTMDSSSGILLCWIADEQKEGVLLATEEVYGVMLRNVSNGEAFELMGASTEELTEEELAEKQLWAVGNPVAITDENGLLGALDSICTDAEKNEFILGYTKLNRDLRTTADAADIKVVSGNTEPDIIIESVEYDEYPMPGTETEITVRVVNRGFKAVRGIFAKAEGTTISGEAADEKILWPGTSEDYILTVKIPEGFSKTETLNITVSGLDEGSVYNAETTAEIIYGAYFTVDDVNQSSIPGTKDVKIKARVTNIGNAAGIPEFIVRNSIFGVEDDEKEYEFSGETEVAPGEAAEVEGLIEDTLINEEQTARISVRTGEKSDQFIQEFMPRPAIVVSEEKEEQKPGSSHEHEWSDWVTVNGIRSRECASCGIVVREYIAGTDKTENEQNPETGAFAIVFEKKTANYLFSEELFDRKRRR